MSQPIDDLMALLQIAGPPGGEAAVVQHLRELLLGIGIPAAAMTTDAANEQSEYGGDTGNLLVRIDGDGTAGRQMFSTHMDTVPGAVGARPRLDIASGRIVNDAEGKALGGDNRTGCAVLVQVARALSAAEGRHRPTTLAFLIQEEVGLVGARGLDLSRLGQPRPELCFNFDGFSADEVVTRVIGTQRFTIDIRGRAAHAGVNPGDGVSAAAIAAEAIARLVAEGWHGVIEKPSGQGSANVGIIEGGTGTNVVMPALHILAETRSHDAAFRSLVIERWKEVFSEAAGRHVAPDGTCGQVEFGPGPAYEAFDLPRDSAVVQRTLAAAERCGIAARPVSNDGGMDANWIVAHGIPTVTIGAGQRNVHTPDEYIDLPQFEAACRLGVELATEPG